MGRFVAAHYFMRWLLAILMISLMGLLIAVWGMAHHIWQQHSHGRSKTSAKKASAPDEQSDVETES